MHFIKNATFLSSAAGGRVSLCACVFSLAMGDRGHRGDSPPCISWQSYSSGALLQTVQDITKVLQQRLDTPVNVWDSAAGGKGATTEPAASSSTAQGLTRPWTCGFACRWCDNACTRKEGHNNHSCYEHRHRR